MNCNKNNNQKSILKNLSNKNKRNYKNYKKQNKLPCEPINDE